MDNILSVLHLVKHYGDVKALDGVTFFIEKGQIFGLLGPNGAGKTTSIGVIAQILQADKGKVEIDGMDLKSHSNEIKNIVGLVPQDLAIYSTLNGRENLEFFGSIYGLQGIELKQRVDESLEHVGLTEAAKRLAGTYSGGMKRRLNIAAGLLNRPKLLILDEPAVGVDPQSRQHILESIQKLNREAGISVLYTSHYMEEVQQICDRVAIIDHGKIIADNQISDLIDNYGGGMISLKFEDPAEKAMPFIPEFVSREVINFADRSMSIADKNPHKILPAILENLNSNHIAVEEIEIKRSNLETVFLNLTGRSLRDE